MAEALAVAERVIDKYGVAAVVAGYFMFRDWVFTRDLVKELRDLTSVISRLAGQEERKDG